MNSHRTLCAQAKLLPLLLPPPPPPPILLIKTLGSLSLSLSPSVRPFVPLLLAGARIPRVPTRACVPARTSFSSCEPTMYIQTSELLR